MVTAPILIAGASQHVDLRCTRRLLADGESATINYRSKRPALDELRQAGALTLHADFASEADIFAFIEPLRRHIDSLRAIVHNASDWVVGAPGHEAEAFQQLFSVHMLAPYLISLHCAELLEHSQPADIVHLTDDVACRGSARRITYCASKAGLDNLTPLFAARFTLRIRVSATSPALVMLNDGNGAEYRTCTLAESTLGIEPELGVTYQSPRYLSDNPYVTGTILTVNGGHHVKWGIRDSL